MNAEDVSQGSATGSFMEPFADDRTRVSWLENLRAKDEKAWVGFSRRLTPVIVGVFRRLRLAPQEWADLLSEVTLLVFQKLRLYDPDRGRFRDWLRGVVRNRVCDHYRQNARRFASLDPQLIDRLCESFTHDVGQHLERDRDAFEEKVNAEVRRRLKEPKRWEVYKRTQIDGQPRGQVAEEFNLTEKTVAQYESTVNALRELVVKEMGIDFLMG
jgi:RNA polymerase sigma factor (sigma-70 family)